MTPQPQPTRSIPLYIGGREYDLIWYRLGDEPLTRPARLRQWLWRNTAPLLFVATAVVAAAALAALVSLGRP
jgi:hypothetical protein